jgi:tetratricopeptide (TPR) repeat protein
MFNRFAYYLQTASKDSAVYVNYMCGKYYFEAKDYASAFAYFSKIADAENPYSVETWFRLGEISILVNKKPQQAAQYFSQVIEKDKESDYGYQARIELALIYHENAREEEAMSMLKEIMGTQKKRTYAIQAENIYNSFQNEIKQN